MTEKEGCTPNQVNIEGKCIPLNNAIQIINTVMEKISPEKKEGAAKKLFLEDNELIQFQQLQSRAFAMQKITYDTAQTLYRIYGREYPSKEKFTKLSIGERYAGIEIGGRLARMAIDKKI